jgi:hypothetical protein
MRTPGIPTLGVAALLAAVPAARAARQAAGRRDRHPRGDAERPPPHDRRRHPRGPQPERPLRPHAPGGVPNLDDNNSYAVEVDAAEIGMGEASLNAMLSEHVFGHMDEPPIPVAHTPAQARRALRRASR